MLHEIKSLTQDIEQVEGVEYVLSLTNAHDPVGTSIKQIPPICETPTTPATPAALQAKLADRPNYLDNLAATDASSPSISIFFVNVGEEEFIHLSIDDKI